jgi:hypothetical protein
MDEADIRGTSLSRARIGTEDDELEDNQDEFDADQDESGDDSEVMYIEKIWSERLPER